MTWESRSILKALVADLGLDPEGAAFCEEGEAPGRHACIVVDGDSRPALRDALKLLADSHLSPRGCFLICRREPFDAKVLSRYRNALWPDFHIPVVYRLVPGEVPFRMEHGGQRRIDSPEKAPSGGHAVAAIRGEDSFSQDTVVQKFDRNAAGWNGDPGAPSYGHFRWMRRIVADAAGPGPAERVLDAGCGAGWVGIEAALRGANVASFDPSPEMVRLAESNARDQGVEMEFKVGFTEAPPFEECFDKVISAGVISFSPDQKRFMDGLDSRLKPGGVLVIADLNPLSMGMRYRRACKPLVPSRELNAVRRTRVMEMLRSRGYRIEKRGHYQLTLPVPLLMHLSETRWGGLGSSLLLWCNKTATALDSVLGSIAGAFFDSYIVRARKGPTTGSV